MAIFIVAYQNRTTIESITFYDEDGAVPTLGSQDKVRIKIGKAGADPLKDIVNGTPLTNGTSVNAVNPATFEIVGTDFADMKPGVYDIEALVVDHADNDRTKMADEGVFTLIGTQGGSLG